MRRVTVPAGGLAEDVVSLDPEVVHHLRDVLRLGDGERLELGDGEGVRAWGRLEGPRVAVDRRETLPLPRPEITLLQAAAKGEKMDRVVRQVAELGVRRFAPVRSARSVPRGGGRPERWRSIAEDALRVSGRAYRMRVGAAQPLDRALSALDAELKLAFDGRGETGIRDLPDRPPGRLALLVGPEGGLAPDELEQARAAGFRHVTLGAATLRTETAAPAIVAALTLGRWGGLA